MAVCMCKCIRIYNLILLSCDGAVTDSTASIYIRTYQSYCYAKAEHNNNLKSCRKSTENFQQIGNVMLLAQLI